MLATNHIAFKEWAAICAALGDGTQSLIVRKGGIHEGRDGFRVAHGEFWLFPTYVHEAADGLEKEAGPLLARAEAERPSPGTLRIAHYAVVTDVHEVCNEAQLARLAGQHLWSPQTISDRFHYRQPGLFVMTVRVYEGAKPHVIPDSPHFAGCRSWVELPLELSTAGLQAVLSNEEFLCEREKIKRALDADSRQA
jgi:hypothetical protein